MKPNLNPWLVLTIFWYWPNTDIHNYMKMHNNGQKITNQIMEWKKNKQVTWIGSWPTPNLDTTTNIHGFSNIPSWLTNIFWLMHMYILTKGLGLEWDVYFLTNLIKMIFLLSIKLNI